RILGWEEFRGVRVRLTEAVLVPRPETETLVEWALALLPPPGGRRPLAIDVGTGSGCIACALAAERGDLDVVAVDVSPAAAAGARPRRPRPGARPHRPAGGARAGPRGSARPRRIRPPAPPPPARIPR